MRKSMDEMLDNGKRPLELICEFRFVDLEDSTAIGKLVVDERDRVSFTIYRDVIHSAKEEAEHPIVHATSEWDKFTLLNCSKGSCRYNPDQPEGKDDSDIKHLPYEKYDCSSMLVGCHLEQSDLERVNRYKITFDVLAIWLNVIFFEAENERGEDTYNLRTTRSFLNSVDCIDEVIGISLSSQCPYPLRGRTELTASKIPWLHSTLKNPIALEGLHRFFLRWHDLFTFVCFREICWGAIYIGFEGIDEGFRWISSRYMRKVQKRRLFAYDMLFDHDDQRNDPSKVLTAWAQVYDQNQSSIRLFCSTFTGKNYHEHNFLSLVQTLESYQYATVPRKLISDSEYEPMLASILAPLDQSLPNDIRKSIENCLKHANSLTLAQLLRAVYNNLSSYFPDTYLTPKQIKKRFQRIKDSRNNFVHNGKLVPDISNDKYEGIFDDEELLRYLIIATIAKETEIDERSISETIARMIHDHSVTTVLFS